MNRKLRIFALFAILLASLGACLVRGEDVREAPSAKSRLKTSSRPPVQTVSLSDDGNEQPSVDRRLQTGEQATEDRHDPGEKPLEELVPRPESLLPNFEPEVPDGSALDTGTTPPRWLDRNDQFLNEGDPYPPGADPFQERPGIPVGWFAAVDLNIVQPRIDSQVNNSVLGPNDPFTGTFTNHAQLPTGPLDWTVMPKISLGYRRENGLGEFLASYRYLHSDASGTIANFDAAGSGQVNIRTQVHVLDLTYGFTDRTDDLPWFLPTVRRYALGLRVASWTFDTTANGGQTLEERAGNVFIGGGPVLTYDWQWLTPSPALTFDGGFDVAGVGGFNYQRFGETAIGSTSARGRTDGSGTATPILGVWGGLAWAPEWGARQIRMSAGYRWERWWNLPDAGGQNDLTLQGPYVRGEFRW